MKLEQHIYHQFANQTEILQICTQKRTRRYHKETRRNRNFQVTIRQINLTTTSHINHIQDYDNDLAKKITQSRNTHEKNPNF